MRLGGALYACKSGKVARHVVTALVVVAGFAVAGQGLSAGGAETTKDLWALTRDAHGRIHVVRGLDAAVATMDNRLGRDSTRVLSVEKDQAVRVLSTNDALRPQQWALNAVGFESAWRLSSGAGVKVAVIDTGVLGTHEELSGSVVSGLDLASDTAMYDPARNGTVEPAGRGTHVNGMLAAHAYDGIGIA